MYSIWTSKMFFLFLMVGLIHTTISAQTFNSKRGIIIKNNSDTLLGQIKDQHNLVREIQFKPESQEKFVSFSPAEINAFAYEDGIQYRSVSVPINDSTFQQQFLLCLVDGYMSLFYKDEQYYIAQPNATLLLIDKNSDLNGEYTKEDIRFRRTLSYLMKDCGDAVKAANRAEYNSSSLSRVVKKYNECKLPGENPVVNKERFRMKVRLGARLGGVNNTMSYTRKDLWINKYTIQPELGFSGGITCNLSFTSRFSVQPEVLLTRKGGYIDYNYESYDDGADFSQFNFVSFQIPVTAYYHIGNARLQPFIGAGGVWGYFIKNEVKGLYDFYIENDEIGLRGSTGLSYRLAKNRKISLEYVYERTLVNRLIITHNIRMVSQCLSLRIQF